MAKDSRENSTRSEFASANGIRFHLLTDGVHGTDADRPLLLLLHGFPQTSEMWRRVLQPLAAHGFRVVAPDLRGIGQSSRPTRVRDYRLSILADDIVALTHALGHEKAHVVGHDWGGLVAWAAAALHPEAVDRLVIVNSPPPLAWVKAWVRSPRQFLRSWYVLYFQLPMLPEHLFSWHRGEIMERLLRDGDFSAEEIEQHRQAITRPGAAWAGLAYYRAMGRYILPTLRQLHGRKVRAPTLVLWGDRDVALGVELTQHLDRYVSAPLRVEHLPDVAHWVVQDRPDWFVEQVALFLQEAS
jgi:pimeloyl-ACP methyl ester carboxylesterase